MSMRNVIWIASYPKSGNTWVGSVLRVAGRKHGFPDVSMDPYEMAFRRGLPSECPCVNPRFLEHPCSVLKTHSAYDPSGQPHSFPGIELNTVGFAHIYRNPLDVLLSYLSFTRIEYKANSERDEYKHALFIETLGFDEPIEYADWAKMDLDSIPRKNLDYALDSFSDHGLAISTLTPMAGSWPENTQSWLDAAKDIPGYSIRYEDCLIQPEKMTQLASLFSFAKQDIAGALKHVNKQAHQMSASTDPYQSVFYNKLTSYYFVSYFSPHAIRRFCSAHEGILRKFGYENILNMI